jgi:uncharacterized Zn finger protein
VPFDYGDARPAIRVEGGIRSQGKLKGQTWWATRWMQVLEGFYVGGRLARGRTYARKGQVLSIEIQPGHVKAAVQGSRPKPYKVSIGVKPLGEEDWKRVVDALQSQAGYAARLLNGELPPEVEALFDQLKLSLFPKRSGDLDTSCSCPDWSNPCKHVAAVFYLVGEEFERDPFLIFRLRGLKREDLTASLHAEPQLPPEPLSVDGFWGEAPPEVSLPEIPKSSGHAALARQLGSFPFWRGETRFLDEMETLYAAAAKRAEAALARLAGDGGA